VKGFHFLGGDPEGCSLLHNFVFFNQSLQKFLLTPDGRASLEEELPHLMTNVTFAEVGFHTRVLLGERDEKDFELNLSRGSKKYLT